jgi:hypothetical protein
MKLYQHIRREGKRPCPIVAFEYAWFTRITQRCRHDQNEWEEIWCILWPSYGMVFDINRDEMCFGQRGSGWNMRTGERFPYSRILPEIDAIAKGKKYDARFS